MGPRRGSPSPGKNKNNYVVANKCVDTIVTKKMITEHSEPWISVQLAEQLKKLSVFRKKCRHQKSPVNMALARL